MDIQFNGEDGKETTFTNDLFNFFSNNQIINRSAVRVPTSNSIPVPMNSLTNSPANSPESIAIEERISGELSPLTMGLSSRGSMGKRGN